MTHIRAVMFDAYGTLLDVHAAMARHASGLGSRWPEISADWRRKQLEYSWIRSLAGPAHHRDFWRLTQDALAWTAAQYGITDQDILTGILMAYRRLDPYPEAASVLSDLRHRGLATAILSNGEPAMLDEAITSAGLAPLLDHVLSVETAGVFKPDPRVYAMAATRLDLAADRIAFVSSNPWDGFGAAAFGFRVFWVNRAAQPNEYDLATSAIEIRSLAALPDRLT